MFLKTHLQFKEYLEVHHMPGIVGAAGDKVLERKLPTPLGHSVEGKQTLFVHLF